MAEQMILMEKAGEQMNVPSGRAEYYRLLGWKEVVLPAVITPIQPRDPFTPEQRTAIAEIVAVEVARSSLSPAKKKAVVEAREKEEKAKAEAQAEEEKAQKAEAVAVEKAAKEANKAAAKK